MTTSTQADEFDVWVAEKKHEAWSWNRGSYPMRDLIQVDGWTNDRRGDQDGDTFSAGPVREPQQTSTTVRILIAQGARPEDVLRVLRKQLAWLESEHGPLLDEPDPSEPPF